MLMLLSCQKFSFLQKYFLRFYVVHSRGNLVSRLTDCPQTVGAWGAQVSSTRDWVLLICPPQWTPCGDLQVCPAHLLAWHPVPQYSWLQSNSICQKTLLSKMQFCFKPKCNMGFVNHKNSHSNYSMMPLMMFTTTEQQPEQITCEILEKNQ